MKIIAFFYALLFIGPVWALGLEEVTLQEVATSGHSLVIDRGTLEQFSEGIYAKFYLQKGPKEYPKIFLVGEGELIKSFPRKSYWLIKKIYIPNAMKANSKILIMTSSQITAGRTLKLKKRHVVLSKEYRDVDDYLDKNQTNIPQKLVKLKDAYEASPDEFDQEELRNTPKDADVLVTTYEKYKKKSGKYYSEEYGDETDQSYFIGDKQVEIGDLKRSEDKRLFDSVTNGMEEKTLNMKYGIKSFYKEQERQTNIPELALKGMMNSTYDDIQQDKKEAPLLSPKVFAKYKRDGAQWSSDMDDVALRKYFIETGIEKENRRRESALTELEGHELILYFSNQISSHGNASDPNYQGRGYNLGISYDLHLGRTSESLRQWSLQFIFEKGITEYDTKVFNARSEETFYGAYLNYYFINSPITLNSFIWLAGVGFKNGTSVVVSPDLSKEYSCQALIGPALQLMTKYRFRSGDLNEDTANIGTSLNFGINMDTKRLSVLDRVEDDINSNISVSDLKYTVGLSVYF